MLRDPILFIPIKVPTMRGRFSLHEAITKAIKKNGLKLEDGDILVVSSKFVAVSEGRYISLDDVEPSAKAAKLARKLRMSPQLAQLVIEEAEEILGGIPEFALTLKDGVLAPNAGIDKSNIFEGYVVLHPKDPFLKAEELRRGLESSEGVHVGVVISDSRLMPTRIGTIGVALGVSGFGPVKDERGRRDLFGKILKVTRRALADDISSGAQLLMGEADEGIPIVVVRGLGVKINDRRIGRGELSIGSDQCIYVRSLTTAQEFKNL